MTCGICNGSGRLLKVDGVYDQPEYLPCPACQFYCKQCRKWVNKYEHECKSE